MCFITILLACTSAKTGDNRVRQNPVYRVGVDTVFLRVSVTDPLDRCVTGLSKENFRVYEDKVEQEISSFSQEPSSVSVGILLDTSGSMKTHNNLVAGRAALHRFLDGVNPGDEFFLIAFNREVSLVKNFTRDAASVLSAGSLRLPSGLTAIL
jgi:Ca-activated chloride channel family protein